MSSHSLFVAVPAPKGKWHEQSSYCASRSDTVHRSCYLIDTVHRAQLGAETDPNEARQSLELMLTRINIYANMLMLSMEGLWDWSYG